MTFPVAPSAPHEEEPEIIVDCDNDDAHEEEEDIVVLSENAARELDEEMARVVESATATTGYDLAPPIAHATVLSVSDQPHAPPPVQQQESIRVVGVPIGSAQQQTPVETYVTKETKKKESSRRCICGAAMMIMIVVIVISAAVNVNRNNNNDNPKLNVRPATAPSPSRPTPSSPTPAPTKDQCADYPCSPGNCPTPEGCKCYCYGSPTGTGAWLQWSNTLGGQCTCSN